MVRTGHKDFIVSGFGRAIFNQTFSSTLRIAPSSWNNSGATTTYRIYNTAVAFPSTRNEVRWMDLSGILPKIVPPRDGFPRRARDDRIRLFLSGVKRKKGSRAKRRAFLHRCATSWNYRSTRLGARRRDVAHRYLSGKPRAHIPECSLIFFLRGTSTLWLSMDNLFPNRILYA